LNLGTIVCTVAINNQALAALRPFDTMLAVVARIAQPPFLIPLIAWAPHLGLCTVMVGIVLNDDAKRLVHVEFQVIKLPPGHIEILPSAACAAPKLHFHATSGVVIIDRQAKALIVAPLDHGRPAVCFEHHVKSRGIFRACVYTIFVIGTTT
jgi:hypothetical protein